MVKNKKNKTPLFFIAPKNFVLVVLIFAVGLWVGRITLIETQASRDSNIPSEKEMQLFFEVWQKLDDKYPFAEKPSIQEKLYSATEGLTRAYNDPYTVFFPPEESKSFQEEISGEFGGVGMEVGYEEGAIVVIAPLQGSPAQASGILAGDVILQIDETSTADMTVDKAIQLIRGEPGIPVKLLIYRKDLIEPLTITITREIISIPTLETELRDDNVFVISLFSFTEKSPRLFHEAIMKFRDSQSKKLILDLRGNPGGYLEAAVDIASYFLPKNEIIVREKEGVDGRETIYKSKGYYLVESDVAVVILVDQGSASASEIVAGALAKQEHVVIVGTKTFGKGSVQELIPIQDGSSLKITVAKWLTPDGISISEDGLMPEIEVERSRENFKNNEDPQLDKAIEILHEKS